MPRTLDRTRKFATTYGEDHRRYYQDRVYFDASGNEVVEPAQPQRAAPPLGAGRPAGKVQPGATSTQVATTGAAAPAVSDEELRAQLAGLKFMQVKTLFVKAGGPEDIKGVGAQARMVDWLVSHRDQALAADAEVG